MKKTNTLNDFLDAMEAKVKAETSEKAIKDPYRDIISQYVTAAKKDGVKITPSAENIQSIACISVFVVNKYLRQHGKGLNISSDMLSDMLQNSACYIINKLKELNALQSVDRYTGYNTIVSINEDIVKDTFRAANRYYYQNNGQRNIKKVATQWTAATYNRGLGDTDEESAINYDIKCEDVYNTTFLLHSYIEKQSLLEGYNDRKRRLLHDVLRLLAEGYSIAEIADILGVSVTWIREQIKNIRDMLTKGGYCDDKGNMI